MVNLKLSVGWLLTLIALASGWEHVTGDELQSSLENHVVSVVAFVFASDKKSEILETEWLLVRSEVEVNFISIDCEANLSQCNSFEATSSSLVKLFVKREAVSTYKGPRRASAISAWVNRMQRPIVSNVVAGSLEAFKEADEAVFVAYLNTDDENSRATFLEVATKYHDEFTFGLVIDPAVIEGEKLTVPAVRCVKPLDGDTHDINDFTDIDSLDKFVKEASRPIIGELLPHTHQRFLDRGWPLVYVFAATETERSNLRKTLMKTARGYYDTLTMVTVDPLEFPGLPEKLGLEPGVFPSGAVHQLSKDRIYPYPKGRGLTPNELQSWGLDVWQGRVKPWTPPGATTSYDDLGGRLKATRSVSMKKIPGVNIRIGGRDEL